MQHGVKLCHLGYSWYKESLTLKKTDQGCAIVDLYTDFQTSQLHERKLQIPPYKNIEILQVGNTGNAQVDFGSTKPEGF